MSLGLKNAGGMAVCVVLLASALAATVVERDPSDRSGSLEAARRSTAVQSSAMLVSRTRLSPAVHPAADQALGERWRVSRRLIMPVAGIMPADLVDTFMQPRGGNRLHEAIDIPAPRGARVLAVTDGIVLRLTEHDSGGISLYLLAPDGQTVFYYAHLLGYADGMRAGRAVRQGDIIGYVGDTGNAGPGNYHLHFEVMTAPDPRQYHAARPRNPYPLLLRTRG